MKEEAVYKWLGILYFVFILAIIIQGFLCSEDVVCFYYEIIQID